MIIVRDALKGLLDYFSGPDDDWSRLAFGGVVVLILVTFTAWQFMVPLWILVALVVAYLRYSRGKDSL